MDRKYYKEEMKQQLYYRQKLRNTGGALTIEKFGTPRTMTFTGNSLLTPKTAVSTPMRCSLSLSSTIGKSVIISELVDLPYSH